MKTIFKILLVISILTAFAQYTKAGDTLDTCWTMVYPDDPQHGYLNPDSVLYDSCQCNDIYKCDSFSAQPWFEFSFIENDPYNFPSFPTDTIIETTWQILDTNYVELRNLFQSLENVFGPFIFRKKFPHLIDSTSLGNRTYLIKFQNYCNIFYVVNYLKYDSLLYEPYYKNHCVHLVGTVDDEITKNLIFSIYPIPCNDILNFSLYTQNLLMYKLYFVDIFGNKYQIKENELILPGEQKIQINTEFLSDGIYLCAIDTGRYKIIRKFIVLR